MGKNLEMEWKIWERREESGSRRLGYEISGN